MLSCVQLFCDPLGPVAHQASLSMGFPRQDTEVGCHFLFQGIFPTQGLNSHLLLGRCGCVYQWFSSNLGCFQPGIFKYFFCFFLFPLIWYFFCTHVGVLNSISQALFIFPYSSFSLFFNLHNLYHFIFKFTISSANLNLLLSHSIEFLILLICNSQLQNFHLVTF